MFGVGSSLFLRVASEVGSVLATFKHAPEEQHVFGNPDTFASDGTPKGPALSNVAENMSGLSGPALSSLPMGPAPAPAALAAANSVSSGIRSSPLNLRASGNMSLRSATAASESSTPTPRTPNAGVAAVTENVYFSGRDFVAWALLRGHAASVSAAILLGRSLVSSGFITLAAAASPAVSAATASAGRFSNSSTFYRLNPASPALPLSPWSAVVPPGALHPEGSDAARLAFTAADLCSIASSITHAPAAEFPVVPRPPLPGSMAEAEMTTGSAGARGRTRSMSMAPLAGTALSGPCVRGSDLVAHLLRKRTVATTRDAVLVCYQLLATGLLRHVPSASDLPPALGNPTAAEAAATVLASLDSATPGPTGPGSWRTTRPSTDAAGAALLCALVFQQASHLQAPFASPEYPPQGSSAWGGSPDSSEPVFFGPPPPPAVVAGAGADTSSSSSSSSSLGATKVVLPTRFRTALHPHNPFTSLLIARTEGSGGIAGGGSNPGARAESLSAALLPLLAALGAPLHPLHFSNSGALFSVVLDNTACAQAAAAAASRVGATSPAAAVGLSCALPPSAFPLPPPLAPPFAAPLSFLAVVCLIKSRIRPAVPAAVPAVTGPLPAPAAATASPKLGPTTPKAITSAPKLGLTLAPLSLDAPAALPSAPGAMPSAATVAAAAAKTPKGARRPTVTAGAAASPVMRPRSPATEASSAPAADAKAATVAAAAAAGAAAAVAAANDIGSVTTQPTPKPSPEASPTGTAGSADHANGSALTTVPSPSPSASPSPPSAAVPPALVEPLPSPVLLPMTPSPSQSPPPSVGHTAMFASPSAAAEARARSGSVAGVAVVDEDESLEAALELLAAAAAVFPLQGEDLARAFSAAAAAEEESALADHLSALDAAAAAGAAASSPLVTGAGAGLGGQSGFRAIKSPTHGRKGSTSARRVPASATASPTSPSAGPLSPSASAVAAVATAPAAAPTSPSVSGKKGRRVRTKRVGGDADSPAGSPLQGPTSPSAHGRRGSQALRRSGSKLAAAAAAAGVVGGDDVGLVLCVDSDESMQDTEDLEHDPLTTHSGVGPASNEKSSSRRRSSTRPITTASAEQPVLTSPTGENLWAPTPELELPTATVGAAADEMSDVSTLTSPVHATAHRSLATSPVASTPAAVAGVAAKKKIKSPTARRRAGSKAGSKTPRSGSVDAETASVSALPLDEDDEDEGASSSKTVAGSKGTRLRKRRSGAGSSGGVSIGTTTDPDVDDDAAAAGAGGAESDDEPSLASLVHRPPPLDGASSMSGVFSLGPRALSPPASPSTVAHGRRLNDTASSSSSSAAAPAPLSPGSSAGSKTGRRKRGTGSPKSPPGSTSTGPSVPDFLHVESPPSSTMGPRAPLSPQLLPGSSSFSLSGHSRAPLADLVITSGGAGQLPAAATAGGAGSPPMSPLLRSPTSGSTTTATLLTLGLMADSQRRRTEWTASSCAAPAVISTAPPQGPSAPAPAAAALPRGELDWRFIECFGADDPAVAAAAAGGVVSVAQVADQITAVQFSETGEFLAIADRAGRVSVVQELNVTKYADRSSKSALGPDLSRVGDAASEAAGGGAAGARASNAAVEEFVAQQSEFRFYAEFTSHIVTIDSLKSQVIEPKINAVQWWPQLPGSRALRMLVTNDKVIKFWSLTEASAETCAAVNAGLSPGGAFVKPSLSEYVERRRKGAYGGLPTVPTPSPGPMIPASPFARASTSASKARPTPRTSRSKSVVGTMPGMLPSILGGGRPRADSALLTSPALATMTSGGAGLGVYGNGKTFHRNPLVRPHAGFVPRFGSTQSLSALTAAANGDAPRPDMQSPPPVVFPACKREFRDSHIYRIHSLSVCADQESFLSADDIRVNLWNVERDDTTYTIASYRPDNPEQDPEELITAVTAHPVHANQFAMGSSTGLVRICDMRSSALHDRGSTEGQIVLTPPPTYVGHRVVRDDIHLFVSSIQDVKFSNDGNHCITRDYMTLRLWDLRNPSKCLSEFGVHDHVDEDIVKLCHNLSIFDPFQCAVSPDMRYICTGSYYNTFCLVETGYSRPTPTAYSPSMPSIDTPLYGGSSLHASPATARGSIARGTPGSRPNGGSGPGAGRDVSPLAVDGPIAPFGLSNAPSVDAPSTPTPKTTPSTTARLLGVDPALLASANAPGPGSGAAGPGSPAMRAGSFSLGTGFSLAGGGFTSPSAAGGAGGAGFGSPERSMRGSVLGGAAGLGTESTRAAAAAVPEPDPANPPVGVFMSARDDLRMVVKVASLKPHTNVGLAADASAAEAARGLGLAGAVVTDSDEEGEAAAQDDGSAAAAAAAASAAAKAQAKPRSGLRADVDSLPSPATYFGGVSRTYTDRMLKMSWHPRSHVVAAAGEYKLFMLQGIPTEDTRRSIEAERRAQLQSLRTGSVQALELLRASALRASQAPVTVPLPPEEALLPASSGDDGESGSQAEVSPIPMPLPLPSGATASYGYSTSSAHGPGGGVTLTLQGFPGAFSPPMMSRARRASVALPEDDDGSSLLDSGFEGNTAFTSFDADPPKPFSASKMTVDMGSSASSAGTGVTMRGAGAGEGFSVLLSPVSSEPTSTPQSEAGGTPRSEAVDGAANETKSAADGSKAPASDSRRESKSLFGPDGDLSLDVGGPEMASSGGAHPRAAMISPLGGKKAVRRGSIVKSSVPTM